MFLGSAECRRGFGLKRAEIRANEVCLSHLGEVSHDDRSTLSTGRDADGDPFFRASEPGQDADSWDGTWNGTLGKNHPWPISVLIANGKVVGFTEKGASFGIQFSKITPTAVVFRDKAHYTMTLARTGDMTASAKVHGRHGSGTVLLTKG